MTPKRFAIIGAACRFPGIDGPAAYWQLLDEGRVAIGRIPPERWDLEAAGYGSLSEREREAVLHGGFFDRIDEFDAAAFGIAAHEARQIDPQQRLALELAAEAFESAGLTRAALRGSDSGVFVGVCTNDYQRPQLADPALNHGHVHTGNAHSIAANRISYRFDLRGPSLAVDTACSSSLVALHLACQALATGEASIALAGGVNLMPSPETSIAFARTGFLSPDGCRSFAEGADGYCRGEGGVFVVVRELEAAIAAGDDIWAVIAGSAVNQNGESLGLVAPNRQAQVDVIRRALRRAGRAREDVVYVEAHGTGTALGDRIEALALGDALGEGRSPERPLRIGSVKSSLGQLEAASGLAGLLKVVLALRHDRIPRTVRCERPNPEIAFDTLGLSLARESAWWPARPRLAGVSAFGFGGTNCHVLVEELARPEPTSTTPSLPVLVLSAPSEVKLRGLAGRLAGLDCPSSSGGDVLAALATRRDTSGKHRLAIRAPRWEEAREALRSFAEGAATSEATLYGAAASPSPLTFVFGDVTKPPRTLDDWDRALSVAERAVGKRVMEIADDDPRLHAVLAMLGTARLLERAGQIPEAIVASGLGRFVAAVWTGAVSLGDALAAIQQGNGPPPAFAAERLVLRRSSPSASWTPSPGDIDPAAVVELASAAEESALARAAWLAARLFVRGHAVRWDGLVPDARNVSLPPTPFVRARYWYAETTRGASTARPAAASSRASTPVDATELVRAQVSRALRLPAGEMDLDVPLVALGVDSLLAHEIVSALDAATGVRLALSTLVDGTTVRALGEKLAAASKTPPRLSSVGPAPLASATSPNQAGLLFVQQAIPTSSAYHVALAFRVQGLDRRALEQSLAAIVARHAELRATFEETVAGFVRGETTPPSTLLPERPLGDVASLGERLADAVAEPFSLSKGPLYRFEVHPLPDGSACVLLVFHHAIVDFWSMVILGRELGDRYRALTSGELSALPPSSPARSYVDFVDWQSELLASERGSVLLDAWKGHLAGVTPVLPLPTDHPRPERATLRGAARDFEIDASTTRELHDLARTNGVTLYTLLLSIYAVLLARWAGQSSFAVGTLANGRSSGGFDDVVGYFVNLTPVPVDVRVGDGFDAHLARVRSAVLFALEHQEYPFSLLVSRLDLPRDGSRQPLCQVLFALEKAQGEDASLGRAIFDDSGSPLALGSLQAETVAIPRRSASFDLSLVLLEDEGRLRAQIQYDTELFRVETIDRLASAYATLARAVVLRPACPLGELPLGALERGHPERAAHAALADVAVERTVWELFEAQARRSPERLAVVGEEGSASYAELQAQAGAIARRLRVAGAVAESIVAVAMTPSPAAIAAVLGVLAAGATCVLLDPSGSSEHQRGLIERTRASFVVAPEAALGALASGGARPLPLDRATAATDLDAAWSGPEPADRAFVITTAGFTGIPKLVEVEHRALAHHLVGTSSALGLGDDEVVLAPASREPALLLLPLVSGGRLALATGAAPSELVEAATRFGVTTVIGTPRVLADLVEARLLDLAPPRRVLSVGDVLPPGLARTLLRAPQLCLVNLYGSAEVTPAAVSCEVAVGVPDDVVPVGRALAGVTTYIVDEQAQPCAPGTPGELLIAGPVVARGYLFDDIETEQRFVPNPFGEGIAFRTGDRAVLGTDGILRIVGRIDRELWWRGVRVEPEAIEAILRQHPRVHDAVVTLEGGGRRARLVAFVVAEATASALRGYLAKQLPSASAPAHFVHLPRLPRLASGKIDLRALSGVAPIPESANEEPSSPLEAAVLASFREVLGAPSVGLDDDFFDFGGHSLLALRLAARLSRVVDQEVLAPTIFTSPTPRALARALEAPRQSAAVSVNELSKGTARRMFWIEPPGAGPTTYAALASSLRRAGVSRIGLLHRPSATDDPTIADLAKRHLRALRAAQPHGPYLLGGWSLGGTIALEMASQLRAAGVSTDLVLVDTVAFHTWDVSAEEAQRRYLAWFLDEWRTAGGLDEDIAAHVRASIASPGRTPEEPEIAALGRSFAEARGLFEAARRYRPRRFDGRSFLILPTGGFADRASWEETLAGNRTVALTAGTHSSVLAPPLVEQTAAAIDDWLSMTLTDRGRHAHC